MLKERSTRSPRLLVPMAPFKELVEKGMAEFSVEGLKDGSEYVGEGLVTPLEQMTERIARGRHGNYESVARKVYDLLNDKVSEINFEFADAIVCATIGPWFWYTDKRVSELYSQIGADL